MKKDRLFVIDGNNYLHRAYHALPPLTTKDGRPVGALYGFVRMILSLVKKETPEYLLTVFDTPAPTFRHREFPQYKATRPKPEDALVFQLKNMREIVNLLGVKTFEAPGFEADDIMASVCGKFLGKVKVFILSADKDVSQIVGKEVLIYNEMKNLVMGEAEIMRKYGVSPSKFCDWLALTGDSSDNIPGAKGIGPKSATKLLGSFSGVEEIYEKIDEIPANLRDKLLESRENVFLSKKLVTLLKDVPLDFALDDLSFSLDAEKVKSVAEKWEFSSLLRKDDSSGTSKVFERIKYTDDLAAFSASEKMAVRFVSSKDTTGFAATDGKNAVFIPTLQSEFDFGGGKIEAFLKVLSRGGVFVVTNDAKHLCKFALSKKREPAGPFEDISLMGYVLDSGPSQDIFNLSRKYLGEELPAAVGEKEQAKITAQCFKLREVLKEELSKKGLKFLYEEIELPLARVLAEMELWGVKLDCGILEELSAEMAGEITAVQKTIFSLAGVTFNINSQIEMRRVLFEKLKLPVKKQKKTGASVDAYVLRELSAFHPICSEIIKYRTLSKLKSTYVDALPRLVAGDNRLHTDFNSTGTLTGRLSSSNPNLQNIPVRGEFAFKIRSAFVAEEGCVLISADYSQIDLRALAHFSGDERLLKAFRENDDIHNFTASLVFGVGRKDITGEQRRIAKTVNFGIVYGMSSYGLSADLGISKNEAKKIIDNYWMIFPEVKNYVEKSIEDAKRHGFTETLFKRRRPIYGRSPFEQRVAVNTPIQGTSSDIIKKAMVDIFPILKDYGAKMILQIHDELLFEVENDKSLKFAKIAKTTMEKAVELKVPVKVNVKSGRNFAGMEALNV
ncbi:MAG: DNA polymerase I [bacterium]